MMNLLNPREIATNNLVRRRKEECKDEAADHQDEESDICPIIDTTFCRVPVLADRNSGSNHGAKVENSPEVSYVTTLLCLRRIGHHNSPLRGPEEGSANSKNGA